MMLASFDIFGPIANILGGVEYQIGWTWHVMLPFTFAHVVMCAVVLVGVVADVSIFFFACYLVSCKI